MAKKPVKVVLDTNVIISALGFGGKTRLILLTALDNKVNAITSPLLLAELQNIINKKFPELAERFPRTIKLIRKKFKIVHPKKVINILADKPDNRVLEAALEANCEYIITGDKELLALKSFRKIRIVTADVFLKLSKE